MDLLAPGRLTVALAGVMLVQTLTGLVFPTQYRDPEPIRSSWLGNDWVTLVVVIPMLIAGLAGVARSSTRGLLLWLGMLGYATYNYAFYLFGAALNASFPLYVIAVVLAVVALILALASIDAAWIARSFRPDAPSRVVGGALVVVGVGLATIWIVVWAAHVFAGRPTPATPEAFKVVAALDLALMVPALTAGGTLLWRRRPWGFVLAAIASIQGAAYLLVLTVNSGLAIQRGLAQAPGELPIWGTLFVFMATAALLLLGNVRPNYADE